jgi:hypothetical protein
MNQLKQRVTLLTVLCLIVCGTIMVSIAFAQAPPGVQDTAIAAGLPALGASSPIAFVGKIVNTLLGFVGAVAVALIILAGFRWMTSAGNEEQIREAKSLMRNAIIGLAIVLLAYIITVFTVNSLSRASGGYFGGTTCTTPPPAGPCTPPTTIQCVSGSWVCQ